MPIPTYQDAMLPVLQALTGADAKSRRELTELMSHQFSLSSDERAKLLPSGKAPVILSRVGWALSYMKQAGVVSSPKRGWYVLTDRGHEIVRSGLPKIDAAYLQRYPEFLEFRARSKPNGEESEAEAAPAQSPAVNLALTPEEALEEAYSRLRRDLEAELLDTVKTVTPQFFERLVIDLLVQMGYGGSREEAARAVGKSGDGGIDGVTPCVRIVVASPMG